MPILKPEQTTSEVVLDNAKRSVSRSLAEAGFTHVGGAPLPPPIDQPKFSLKDLREAVPSHCFERSLVLSTFHLAKNVLICAALFYGASYIDSAPDYFKYLLWPLYWFFQGSYLTGIWVIAHECGHQAFSPSEYINNSVGLVLHSALLVPYHSWRISHRKHHSNTGSCENDEVFVPTSKSEYSNGLNEYLEDSPLYNLVRIVAMLLIGWIPGYLVFNATGPSKYKNLPKSHFNPYSVIYNDRERWMIVVSDIFLLMAISSICWIWRTYSFMLVWKFYGIPYLIVNGYLVLITYLQHTDTYIPHFREGEWNWLRGALCTVDRSFGQYLDGVLHHIVDTHVCHHIFSKMPFYHAAEATEALKPLLGKYYLKDATPVPIALWRSYTNCKYVEDDGNVVFYKKKL